MTKTVYTPGDLVDHIAVSAVVKNDSGKILMFRHKKFQLWTIPIGKAEPGETAYEGMCTEVKEECGITVRKAAELVSKPFTYVRNGKTVNFVHHLFMIDEYEGTPTNAEPEKHPEMHFMSIDEIKKVGELSDATLLYLEHIGADSSLTTK